MFEKWVFRPLGTALGLRPTPHRRPPTNDVIEAEFQASEKGVLKEEVALRLAQQTGLSERQVWPLTQSFSSLLFTKTGFFVRFEGNSILTKKLKTRFFALKLDFPPIKLDFSAILRKFNILIWILEEN